MEVDINAWVNEATPERVSFRQAVHMVLHAVASSEYLKTSMVMKGGMLLGIRYHSSRFTEDIDFSSKMKISDVNEDEFVGSMNDALSLAEDDLGYGIRCRVQSLKVQPKNHKDAKFPSFNITIGYARTTVQRELARLDAGQCPNTIKIDYSFNEDTCKVDDVFIGDEAISVYSIYDVVAEKYRSILQQVVRNRNRRQDIYDLYYLISQVDFSEEEKIKIFDTFIFKSKERLEGFEYLMDRGALDLAEVIAASEKDYRLLADEIHDGLPDFNDAYSVVRDFFKNLPWG